jgi:hypothetical protein
VSNSEIIIFFVVQDRTRVCGEAYSTYVAAGKPRRTQHGGKRDISGWTLIKNHILKAICDVNAQFLRNSRKYIISFNLLSWIYADDDNGCEIFSSGFFIEIVESKMIENIIWFNLRVHQNWKR